VPTVYLVEEPLSGGALPGDHLVYWGNGWTLQREIPRPSNDDMGYLKLLHHRNRQPESRAGESPPRPQSHRQPKAEMPEKGPGRP